jgi:hypothetical protein
MTTDEGMLIKRSDGDLKRKGLTLGIQIITDSQLQIDMKRLTQLFRLI